MSDIVKRLRKERDEAQSAVTAWQEVFEDIEAHLLDRVAMQDPAKPELYLSIIRSSVANVHRSSHQIVASRWHNERVAATAIEARDAEIARLRGVVKQLDEFWTEDMPDGPDRPIVLGGAGILTDRTIALWRAARAALKVSP